MGAPITYREEVKRKLIHLSSLWMVVAILLLPNHWWAAGIFTVLLAVTLVFEHAYACRWPVLGPLYGFFFRKMIRGEVKYGQWIVSGGAYVLAAGVLVTVFFDSLPAAAALTVMLTADAAAALVGRRWGKHKTYNNKSIEGVVAFLVAGAAAQGILFTLAGAPGIFYLSGLLALFPAAAAELFEKQLKIDDNFSIPLVVGLIHELAFRLFV